MLRFGLAVLSVLAILLLTVSGGVQVGPFDPLRGSAPVDLNITGPAGERAALAATYSQLPLAFERNQGQSNSRVQFLSRGHGYTLFLAGDEAVLELRKPVVIRSAASPGVKSSRSAPACLRMRLVAARVGVKAAGVDELPGKSNYFTGNNPLKWHSSIPNYAKVKYASVYPGIDLVYYGNQGQLEYDFVVAPGANPGTVQLELAEQTTDKGEEQSLHIDSTGELVAGTGVSEVRFHKPVVYQTAADAGQHRTIDGHYKLIGTNRVGFEISAYDKTKTLVIDPVLSYSSFLGGTAADAFDSVNVAFDSAGNAYVASGTRSPDFPVTAGDYQSSFGGAPAICDQGPLFCGDAFVTKINAAGTAVIYSTYLGGSDSDYAYGLAVDRFGNAYVAGLTKSINFPVTAGAFQATFGGTPSVCDDYVCGDAFVTKLNSTGSGLIYSSYLGGSGNEHPEGLAIDSHGNAYVAGDTGSTDFPTTPGAFQTQLKGNNTCFGRSGAPALCHNAFLTKINSTGTQKIYSTYLGGSTGDSAGGVVVDGSGRASVVGGTCSSDFPVTAGAFRLAPAGGCDIFVTTFNATGTHLSYSTYFGGSGYEATFSTGADAAGNIYLSGFTYSNDFPVTSGAAQTVIGGNADAFVAKFNTQLTGSASLVYASYLGGDQFEIAAGTAVDSQGNAYVSGQTCSTNFPVVKPVQAAKNGGCDAFVTELNPQGSAFVYSTYLGGSGAELADFISVDQTGTAYVAGWTQSADFPITPRAFQSGFGGGTTDVFVGKINPNNGPGISFTPASLTFGPQAVGTTSPAQTVILHDVGSAALVISSMSPGGDFAQTNSCAGSVAGGGSCAVSITFTPNGSGIRNGIVSVSDNAAGSPQKIRLSGTGK
jgi:hypothetical protein